jgi:hypothetical protein
MGRTSGWMLILASSVLAVVLYQYDRGNAHTPGARNRRASNPRQRVRATPSLLNTSGAASGGKMIVNPAGQAASLPLLDPDSDLGVSPVSSPQPEASYYQGANDMSDAFGPGGNQNDEDGLDQLFNH